MNAGTLDGPETDAASMQREHPASVLRLRDCATVVKGDTTVNGKLVNFKVKTTEEALASAGLTIDDVQRSLRELGRLFGTRYLQVFPTTIRTEHIQFLAATAALISRVEHCAGFRRHVNLYDKHNLNGFRCVNQVANAVSLISALPYAANW